MSRPRRLYFGWVQVVAVSVTETISWGVLYYAFAVFLTPMRDELGWSRTAMTGAFSLALLVSGIAAVPLGRWLDRHGPRLAMALGSVLGTASVLLWAVADTLPVFYAAWIGIGLAMAATFYEPAFVLIANWFVRHRSRALTALTFGGGFASVIFVPLADRLNRELGWRGALVVLAVVLGVGTIPAHALLLRRRPADLGLAPDGDDPGDAAMPGALRSVPRSVAATVALRAPSFRWLAGAYVLAMLGYVSVTVHLVPFLIERGFGAPFAAAAAGLVGLLALPGRLLFTPLGSVVSRRAVVGLLFGMLAVSLVVLMRAESRVEIWIFVALYGCGVGAVTPARAALVADLYGPDAYGSISGVLALAITVARAAAPLGSSVLRDWWGRYEPVLASLAVLAALAALAVLRATDRSAPTTQEGREELALR